MGGLHTHPGSWSQRGIHNQLGIPRTGSSQGFRYVLHLTVCRTRLFSINCKCNVLIFSIAFNINRRAVIVLYLQVLDRTGNGRIHGRVYIGHYHGMIVAFHDLQLCAQGRIVQGGRHLTHAASDAVHHLSIGIGGRAFISIGSGKGLETLIAGENLPWHEEPAVDLGGAHRHIGRAGSSAGAEGGGGCAQHILNGGQLLGGYLRLCLLDHCIHPHCLVKPLRQGLIQRLACGLCVHSPSWSGLCDHKCPILSGNGGILRSCSHILAPRIDKLRHTGGSHSRLQRQIHWILRQLLLHHILMNQASARVGGGSLLHHCFIGPVVAQLLGRGLHLLAIYIQRNPLAALAADIFSYRFTGLLRCHACQAFPSCRNSLGKYRGRKGRQARSPQNTCGKNCHQASAWHILFHIRSP